MRTQDVLLVSAQKSDWHIVLPETEDLYLSDAAAELKNAVFQATGCELPVKCAAAAETAHEIVLHGARRPAGAVHVLQGGNHDDYLIRIAPEQIYICGSSSRGTLYGVYAFLETYLGVRYFAADCVYVPARSEIALSSGEIYESPSFKTRIAAFKAAFDPVTRNRHRVLAQEEILRISGHSVAELIPDALFDEHPAYFPLVNGKRIHGPACQRCFSNPDVAAIAIESAKRILRADPSRKTISVSQEDTMPDSPNVCQCSACRAIDEAEGGTPMGSMLAFVNTVAEGIEAEFPDVLVTTLAYHQTRKPPLHIKPRHNVAIVLCSIECCFSHPIESGCGAHYHERQSGVVSSEAFHQDVLAWSSIAEHLFIWDYITDFTDYLNPHPNFDSLGPNYRYFKQHHAIGVYPEGAYDVVGTEMDELRAYVVSKLMWNVDTDVWDEVSEYLIGCLGVAAAPVLKYLRMLHTHMKENHIHMSTYHPADSRMFPKALLRQAHALFERAELLAKDDAALRRVQIMHMSVYYAEMIAYRAEMSQQERCEKRDWLLRMMEELGITGIRERYIGTERSKEHINLRLEIL